MYAPRPARLSDLKPLVALEHASFTFDKISERSFKNFLSSATAAVVVVDAPENSPSPLIGYGLVLFHRGTSLARIYSLAVADHFRGQGWARKIIAALEQCALERDCLFIRLEVSEINLPAIALYRALGFQQTDRIEGYYENGENALRFERRLRRKASRPENCYHYAQTMEFTCGPAALMMAMASFKGPGLLTQINELDIWREATTVFMTSGHGGCSPNGLALAAFRRGFATQLWVSSLSVPFVNSVRDPTKKQIIELIHRDFERHLINNRVPIIESAITVNHLRTLFHQGYTVVVLISTYRLDRNKAPHWVWLVNIDSQFVYINDPYIDEDQFQVDDDNAYVPVPHSAFNQMMRYGASRFSAAVCLTLRDADEK